MRHIFSSQETNYIANSSSAKKVAVYSKFPIDKASCVCYPMIVKESKNLANMKEKERVARLHEKGSWECPRDKTGMTRFVIICKKCKQIQGYCWATDASLKDWCDFHYYQWSDGEVWRGCLTPHISPITEQLCLECCCGQDTRDFRPNMTISPNMAARKEALNKIGREFNQTNSKFLVRKFTGNVLL